MTRNPVAALLWHYPREKPTKRRQFPLAIEMSGILPGMPKRLLIAAGEPASW